MRLHVYHLCQRSRVYSTSLQLTLLTNQDMTHIQLWRYYVYGLDSISTKIITSAAKNLGLQLSSNYKKIFSTTRTPLSSRVVAKGRDSIGSLLPTQKLVFVKVPQNSIKYSKLMWNENWHEILNIGYQKSYGKTLGWGLPVTRVLGEIIGFFPSSWLLLEFNIIYVKGFNTASILDRITIYVTFVNSIFYIPMYIMLKF